jgi:hypothetical protein
MSYVRQFWIPRTSIQREADRLDCDLCRLLGRVEALFEREPAARSQLRPTLRALREARPGLRALMHSQDRSATL